MAYGIQVEATAYWIPDGAGGAAVVGGAQANVGGYGAAGGPGAIPNAQKIVLFVMESVPGGDAPTLANFQTALNNAATDLGTKLNTAGSTGFTTGTPFSAIQGWATGLP